MSGGAAFDLAVVGAGSAGFSAAITAADLGARVVLAGTGTIGGTCVNVGCVPSKALLRAAEAWHGATAAARFAGVAAQAGLVDWRLLVAQKDALVQELRQTKYADLLPAYPAITYREGAARLVDGGILLNGERLAAGRTIVATGARPSMPAIPGIDSVPCLTSTTALALTDLPASMLVIGGGYVGVELAQLFGRVGVAVTLVCRSRLLPAAEPEIGEALARCFAAEGIEVVTGATYRMIREEAAGAALVVDRDGRERRLAAQTVLLAAGRTPNIEGLGLAGMGIELAAHGGIRTDAWMRTTRPGVYAAGDVTGRDQFVYMAAHGARIAARNALLGDELRYDNRAMPAVAFTDPQMASVGLTEAAARMAGHAVRVARIGLESVPRALAARDTRGLIKLVADGDSRRLLGAHLLAPEGADSIQTAALAIRQGLTIDDLVEMVFPYLTTVEGLKLAAQAFDRDVAKLSCCAG